MQYDVALAGTTAEEPEEKETRQWQANCFSSVGSVSYLDFP